MIIFFFYQLFVVLETETVLIIKAALGNKSSSFKLYVSSIEISSLENPTIKTKFLLSLKD